MIFLGPPLPIRDQLFVLVEMNSAIRLLALDAETGSLLWSQALAAADRKTPEAATLRSFALLLRRDSRLPDWRRRRGFRGSGHPIAPLGLSLRSQEG